MRQKQRQHQSIYPSLQSVHSAGSLHHVPGVCYVALSLACVSQTLRWALGAFTAPAVPCVLLLDSSRLCSVGPVAFFHTSAARRDQEERCASNPAVLLLLLLLLLTTTTTTIAITATHQSAGTGGSLPWQLAKKAQISPLGCPQVTKTLCISAN